MELTYLGHAGFLVESEDHVLVIDPWLSSRGAFLSSWYQYPQNHDFIHELKRRLAGKHLAVYVTHEHEDHFCRDTLRELLELKPRFLAPHYAMPDFREGYEEVVGGAVLEIDDQETITFGDFQITVFVDEGGISRDSAVLVADKEGRRFLNLNDCKIYDRCRGIKETYGEIHVLACQFAGAVMHPICYDYPEDERRKIGRRKRYSKLAGVANVIQTIEPQMYLPSAGPPAFLDPRLYHLNFEIDSTFPRWWEFQDFLDKRGKLGATRFVPLKVGGRLLVGAGAPDPASVARRLSADEHRKELEGYCAANGEQTGTDRPRRELPAADVILRRLGEVLRAKVQPFLEMKGTLPLPVPVYFALEDASDYIKVDFAACRAERTSKISDEKYYLHRAIREDIYPVVLGEVPWSSYWLTFRFKNVRVPDDYSSQINLFFISNSPDEVRYGLLILARFRHSAERITVCDPESGKTFTCARFCAHQGADLTYARVEGGYLVCPRHYWRYQLSAGGKCDRSEDTIKAEEVDARSAGEDLPGERHGEIALEGSDWPA